MARENALPIPWKWEGDAVNRAIRRFDKPVIC